MKVLRLDAVILSTGLARSRIYKLIGSGEFPRPVPLTGRSVGWIESEVAAWIRSRIAERDAVWLDLLAVEGLATHGWGSGEMR